jgi:membrane protease YdiL (CAAX protease family)
LAAGSGQDISLVGRKLAILFGQIKSILFLAILMIVVVVVFALWMKRPGSMWRERWKTDTAWTAGLFAILLGSIVALVFNDTGIAMMGSMVMVTVPVLVYHFTEPLKESP